MSKKIIERSTNNSIIWDAWDIVILRGAIIGIVSLVVFYLFFWYWNNLDSSWQVIQELMIAVITNSIPVLLGFVGSYLFSRRMQKLRTAEENLSFAELVANTTTTLLSAPLNQIAESSQLSGLALYKDWTDPRIFAAIGSARHSIDIIETWIGNLTPLANAIEQASRNAQSEINVNVYMLDPKSPFGGQRLAEIQSSPNDHSKRWLLEYQKIFETSKTEILRIVRTRPNTKFKIHTYDIMPVIRMIIIDDIDFIFGWFPSNKYVTQNACYRLIKSLTSIEVNTALTDLEKQANYIKLHSKQIDTEPTP